jgi:hypothetical protein
MTDTKTQSPAQVRARLTRSLTAVATRVDKLKTDTKEAQGDLDKLVLEGKNAGFKYRELAEITGRSVAWVQATLTRGGYKATKGPRSKSETASEAPAA